MLTYLSRHVDIPEQTCWRSGSCRPWGPAWSVCSPPWRFSRFPRDRPPSPDWRIGRGRSLDTGSGPCPRWGRSAWRTAHWKEEGRNYIFIKSVYLGPQQIMLIQSKLCWFCMTTTVSQQYMEAAMSYFCWYFQPVLSFSSQWTQVLPLGST